MNKAKFIEITLFKTKEGVNQADFQAEMKQWNTYLANHNGFISRKIAVSADGQYADINYWTDLEVPKTWFDDKNPEMVKLFDSNMAKIDEETLSDMFFEIFNEAFAGTDKATVADIFLFKPKAGVTLEAFEKEMIKFNNTLADYKGLVSRTNGVSANGNYLELVYWTDFEAIKSAEEKGAQDTEIEDFFTQMTNEESVFSNRFEIFSDI
jgi:hypothetical protein